MKYLTYLCVCVLFLVLGQYLLDVETTQTLGETLKHMLGLLCIMSAVEVSTFISDKLFDR